MRLGGERDFRDFPMKSTLYSTFGCRLLFPMLTTGTGSQKSVGPGDIIMARIFGIHTQVIATATQQWPPHRRRAHHSRQSPLNYLPCKTETSSVQHELLIYVCPEILRLTNSSLLATTLRYRLFRALGVEEILPGEN